MRICKHNKNRLGIGALLLAALLVVVGTSLAAVPRISPGHVLNITVLGHPELSMSATVRMDGTTDYPLLYNIPVDGMELTELRELLLPLLTRMVEKPNLFINLSEFMQVQVIVQGQVNQPGPRVVKGPIDLQGLIAVTGGPTQLADLSRITINRGQNRVIHFDLEAFLRDPEGHPIPIIENGDIVFVPTLTNEVMVRVFGEVVSPGSYHIRESENLADVIYMAGGPRSTANLKKITLVRGEEGGYSSQTLNLHLLLKSADKERIPRIQPGDVIIVPGKNEWGQLHTWASILRDLTLLLTSAVILSRI